ncbi:twin-arginine translocase subunit TatB [Aliidiomarina minuta]|uniref:Sec-independent protein translocase protein TatB n=1 Tax=Aliidiomarina minuta TaxID=880057 RepID=A0A432W3T6_9GAMM|nr:Sec-independent protein translocase protein TatB [Aliidiomarina minuta]RUO24007.1 twin-arginine translocase subunit TatB [Aliidiomarina minuta]
MFDIGFWELLIIALMGLLVLGPERLPRAIRSVQRGMARARQFGSRMEAELNHELRIKELHENLKKIESADDIDNLPDDLKKSLAELQRAAASVQAPYAKKDAAAEKPSEEKNKDAEDKPNESG